MKNLMTKTMKTLAGQPSEATQPKAAGRAMGLALTAERSDATEGRAKAENLV